MTTEERLENMERELGRQKRCNRWLLGAILLVAGGLIIPVLFGITAFRTRAQATGTAREIRARSFVLEDEYGKTRAWLSVIKDGPGLALYGENGKVRAVLNVIKDGPGLRLLDESGNHRAGMSVLKDSPKLTLVDKNGKSRVRMDVLKGDPKLVLFDENGDVIWSARK